MSENVIVHKIKSDAGTLVEYHVDGVSDWNFFDSLLEFFKKQYGAVVENFTDGIFTRSYQLRVNGEYFMLEHNGDIGNWFFSCAESGDSPLMHVLADDLEARLKDVPYE